MSEPTPDRLIVVGGLWMLFVTAIGAFLWAVVIGAGIVIWRILQ